MAGPHIILCRRTTHDFGQPTRYCAKPIKNRYPLAWCDDCLAKLPHWPKACGVAAR